MQLLALEAGGSRLDKGGPNPPNEYLAPKICTEEWARPGLGWKLGNQQMMMMMTSEFDYFSMFDVF